MTNHPDRKLAVILHADVIDSTLLVQKDEARAHERMVETFKRLSKTIGEYDGITHEIRGDALLAEFSRASDAITAALEFQKSNSDQIEKLDDDIRPALRIGVSMGEVIVADNTMTGAGVVMAQRLEQLAHSGGLVIQGAAYETLPKSLPLDYENLGELQLKGFEEPVRAYRVRLQSDDSSPQTEPPASSSALKHSDKPTIAVLPFESTKDPEFGEDIANDIIIELGRFSDFEIAAPQSSFAFRDQFLGVVEIAKRLDVNYVLQGRVQISGKRIRISVQLGDGESGQQLWGERFDRDTEDLFQVQDEVTAIISASLAHRIDSLESNKRMRNPRNLNSALDYYVKGREIFFARTRETNTESRKLVEHAIELDDQMARAHGFLAFIRIYELRSGWSDDPEEALASALKSALKAHSLDPSDPVSHWRLGASYLNQREFEKAISEYEKARLQLPNHAGFLTEMAGAYICTGRVSEAIDQIKRAMQINPNYPEWFYAQLGWAYHAADDNKLACEMFLKMNELSSVYMPLYIVALVRSDRIEKAKEMARVLLRQEPEYSVSYLEYVPYQNESLIVNLQKDLHLAGVPWNDKKGFSQ